MAGTRKPARVAALAAAIAVAAAGCGGGDEASTDKAGGTGEPVTLRMADGYAHLDYEPAVTDFVLRVGELSEGALEIEVVHNWGDSQPDFEQQVVRDTAAGEIDLAWAGTRIFDTLDVTTFQALTAPMLIDSYPVQQAVIDSDIPAEMLAGLDELGLTGLGVLAGGLRKPIAVKGPLLSPADWNGMTFQAFRSEGQADAIRALGAEPTDIWSDPLDAALAAGEVGGFEKNLLIVQINNTQGIAPYVTANVNLWPETAVLFANSDRFESLTDEQREWLRQAAADAAERSTEMSDRDADVLVQLCEAGARAADASEADLAALRDALSTVYATLEQHAGTKAFIEQIEELKGSITSEPLSIPPGCTGEAPGAAAAPPPGVSSELNGTYRWTLTPEDALEHGTPADQTPDALAAYPYTFTMTLTDGAWELHYRGAQESGIDGNGTHVVEGDRFTINWPRDSLVLEFTFSTDADGNLTLEPLESTPAQDAFVMTTQPWTKID